MPDCLSSVAPSIQLMISQCPGSIVASLRPAQPAFATKTPGSPTFCEAAEDNAAISRLQTNSDVAYPSLKALEVAAALIRVIAAKGASAGGSHCSESCKTDESGVHARQDQLDRLLGMFMVR